MMKFIFFFTFFMLSSGLTGQINFSGSYTGSVKGDPTKIILSQQEMIVTGEYQETGNTYMILGEIESDILHGQLIIQGTELQLGTFDARLTAQGMHLDILIVGVTKVSADFIKELQNTTSRSIGSSLIPESTKDNNARDPLVIGHWLKEEVINSGFGDQAAGMTTAYYLTFSVDGTFIQEKTHSAGGSNWSGGAQRTLDANGQWYTKDQIMYIKLKGQASYVRLNQYLFHDNALVFKTPEGKYLIWNRN